MSYNEFKEDQVSLSDNNCRTQKVKYATKATQKVYSIMGLAKILDKIGRIDYTLVYHQDDEDVISYILSLRDELHEMKSVEEREKITNKLRDFEPAVQVKISILIKDILYKAEVINGGGIGVIRGLSYVYNGCYWEFIPTDLMMEFLSEAAIKSGFNEFHAKKAQTVKMFAKQFFLSSNIPITDNGKSTKVMINLKNGTFVYEDGKYGLREFCSDDLLTYQLSFPYDPEATAPKYMAYLNEVMEEKEAQMVMAEYGGCIFAKNLKLEKCLVLVGTGANGKSVWGNIMTSLLGEENVTAFSLSNLCDRSGYYRAEMSKYLLSYSSEINGKGCDPDIVKQIISNEPISGRSPYGEPVTVTNYCRFLFNANILPKDVEQSYGYYRRFMFLKFDVTIPEDKRNPNLSQEIIETERSGVFNWVLEGLSRLLIQKKFTYSPKIESALVKATTESNSVALFINERNYIPSSGQEYVESQVLYEQYVLYCKESGHPRPVSRTEFLRRLEEQLNFHVKRKATNNRYRVFCVEASHNTETFKETQDLVARFAESSINKKLE